MARKISTSNLSHQVLAVWLNYWLGAYAKPNVTKSTYYGYRRIAESYIIPEIGEICLFELSVKRLQKFFNNLVALREQPLSQKSIKNIYDMLHIVIDTAVEAGVVEENNLKRVILPECKERNERFLTYNEQFVLRSSLKKQSNISAVGIMLILETGIKKKELLCLKWSDVDHEKICFKFIGRNVPLTSDTYAMLMEYKVKQKAIMEQRSLTQTENTYIISNKKFERYTPNGYNILIKRIATECDLHFVTATVLRNTYGANCIKAGVELPVVSHIMGDCNVSITKKRYAKLLGKLDTKTSVE